jgi:hypothetical protein
MEGDRGEDGIPNLGVGVKGVKGVELLGNPGKVIL